MTEPFLDQGTLKRLLHYDPETGVFTWLPRPDARRCWNTRYAGKRAGYAWRPNGHCTEYWVVRIFDWPFLGHRLACLFMTGAWPVNILDHEDRDGLNNRWANLRDANRRQNVGNAPAWRTNKLGVRGVSRVVGSNKYRANIRLKGKQTHLGHFDTIEEAAAAYKAAAKAYYGEFAETTR